MEFIFMKRSLQKFPPHEFQISFACPPQSVFLNNYKHCVEVYGMIMGGLANSVVHYASAGIQEMFENLSANTLCSVCCHGGVVVN